MGQNFLFLVFENKKKSGNAIRWDTHWTFEHGYRFLVNMWLDSLKCLVMEKKDTFSNFKQILESIYVFWQNN